MKSLFLVAAVASAVAPAAMAQGLRGVDPQGGLHWSVAAPQGASWSLDCRFRPVTVQGALTNQSTHTGSGPMRGRLPADNARCTLKKTGGRGPIGIAVVKNGQATADGTNDAAKAAFVDVF
jgi:hypothetical protein